MTEEEFRSLMMACVEKSIDYMKRIKVILPENDLISVGVLENLYLEYLSKAMDEETAISLLTELPKKLKLEYLDSLRTLPENKE